MGVLVIGGHTRNIGKTALGVDLIRALPEAHWTAVKITQYGHGICSVGGRNCGCAPDQHTVSLDEERGRNHSTDTSRFLAAGAERAFWLRCKQGRLAEAMPLLRDILRQATHALVESNTLLQFLRPELYLVVLDPTAADFKDSALQALDRADALVLRAPWVPGTLPWAKVAPRLLEGRLTFQQRQGEALPAGLVALVRERLLGSEPVSD